MHRCKRFVTASREWINRLALRVIVWPEDVLARVRSDAGQTVAEYALVLLVVAAIAVAFLVWAKSSGKLDSFFNAIFDKLANSVDPNATPGP